MTTDTMTHGAPANEHETARVIATKIHSRFVGDIVSDAIVGCTETLAAVTADKTRFHTMQELERVTAADRLEQMGLCAYRLAAVLRGKVK